ncbi:hypothetical protein NDN08_005542 [Rhodosorus marinus]|uniref:AAA+ ATPase domain-containing protein n=1 Tax=Rhodosorus marinus TaxID=101924 RepID=A0AAV8V1V4_9RHOD|nr:hypothetical protein NDN08_005542 [Rhodosorus marinus]
MLRLGVRRLLSPGWRSGASILGVRTNPTGVRYLRISNYLLEGDKRWESYKPKKSDQKKPEVRSPWSSFLGGENRNTDSKKVQEPNREGGNGGDGGNNRGKGSTGPGGGGGGSFNWTAFALGGIIGVVILRAFSSGSGTQVAWDEEQIDWQRFKTQILPERRIEKITVVNNDTAHVFMKGRGPESNYRFSIGSTESFESKLQIAQEDMGVAPSDFIPVFFSNEGSVLGAVISWLPTVLLIGSYVFLMRRVGGGAGGGSMGGQGGIFNVGKAKTVVLNKDNQKVATRFKDVAGLDEAKQEVMEFVDYLKNPERYKILGAKIPKGALLHGPPGTGKTLLAKATAGESGVPFLSISGSDFMEMFVGVGPSRVRDLFSQARQNSPCIIFIDEIDAIGRSRGRGGLIGGNDERENTLNQLLVEMDGFQQNSGVVVLAGTNRVDVLDQALLRPGRFDRQIVIDNPDVKGRKQIFMVHLKKVVVANPPGKEKIAEALSVRTPGFSGAQIANVCNEAALIAARDTSNFVTMEHFEYALDRIIGGLEKKNLVMTPEEKRTVAYHEAGHAVTGWFLEHALPLLKVSIVPRGEAALGYAQYQPQEQSLMSTEQLKDMMCMTLGGRAAEEVFFDTVTTGAADDFRKVTQMAYQSVTQYGFGKAAGLLSFPTADQDQGAQMVRPYSNATADAIDREVRTTVDDLYTRTVQLLKSKKAQAAKVAELLLRNEVIMYDDMVNILGERPFKPQDRSFEQITKSAEKEPIAEVSQKS